MDAIRLVGKTRTEVSAINPVLTPPTKAAHLPEEDHTPDNYVSHILKSTEPLPPITWQNILIEINWLNFTVLTIPPIVSLYGFLTTELTMNTLLFTLIYMYFTAFGITAGYHRLWAHRSYNASKGLQYYLAISGAGAVQGSIKWWARGHRAHHRYTDTDLDPYNAHRGLFWSHIGWMLVKPRRKPGVADVSDLHNNPVISWQHRWYIPLVLIMAFGIPTAVAGLGWGDWRGGLFYAGTTRLVIGHHMTFCINSLAHYIGHTPFDDRNTPRDHVITAIFTNGEGYHNFHHQFPMDYRNGYRWYQYDPTKWFIIVCSKLGVATHLRRFPDNEVRKGMLTMELKKLCDKQDKLVWPKDSTDLPVISWESFKKQSLERPLVLVSGFIHDVTSFMKDHPGGHHLLAKNIGKDATTAFFGGVHDHSNAAHNLLAMMRVGVLHGGVELEAEHSTPPSQKLRIVRARESASS